MSSVWYIMSDLPYNNNDSFGKRVRKLRRTLDMSQEELANKIETSRSYISALEHDEYEPKLETMKKVAKALKIKLDELVKGL
jgi:ribosome-binding protein aMBF1 (putative translation factor)